MWVFKSFGYLKNVWVFTFVGTQKFVDKQNLWVVEMWVLKIVGIHNVGIQNCE